LRSPINGCATAYRRRYGLTIACSSNNEDITIKDLNILEQVCGRFDIIKMEANKTM
ncbi:4328_t:CDS:2, partial [Racocetra persica]